MKKIFALLMTLVVLTGCNVSTPSEDKDTNQSSVPSVEVSENPSESLNPSEEPSENSSEEPSEEASKNPERVLKEGIELIKDIITLPSKAGVKSYLGNDYEEVSAGPNGKALGWKFSSPDLTVVFAKDKVDYVVPGEGFEAGDVKLGADMEVLSQKYLMPASAVPYSNKSNFAIAIMGKIEGVCTDMLCFDSSYTAQHIVFSKKRQKNYLIEKPKAIKLTKDSKKQLKDKVETFLAAQMEGDASYKSFCSEEFVKRINKDKRLLTCGFKGQDFSFKYLQKHIMINDEPHRFTLIARVEKNVKDPALAEGYFVNYYIEFDDNGYVKLYDIALDI